MARLLHASDRKTCLKFLLVPFEEGGGDTSSTPIITGIVPWFRLRFRLVPFEVPFDSVWLCDTAGAGKSHYFPWLLIRRTLGAGQNRNSINGAIA